MRFGGIYAVAFLLLRASIAQTPENGLRSKVQAVRYPQLGEQARIQGDVHLKIHSDGVTTISGHPLLAETAVESAKAFEPVPGQPDLDVTYHFVFADTTTSEPTTMTVKKGTAFERALLRILGLRTTRSVSGYRCQEGVPPPNEVMVTGAVIEIWIYGRSHCVQTEATTLIASR